MTLFSPYENKKIDIIAHLDEMRRRILVCLVATLGLTVLAFLNTDKMMPFVLKPIEHLVPRLIFISPTEGFISNFKIAFLVGFLFAFPLILYNVWGFIAPAFEKEKQKRIVIWLIFSFFLFFFGISFSYFLAIPRALSFLLSFDVYAEPMITIGKYVSFFTALIFVGGTVFEIPVVIGLLTDLGIVSSKLLRAKRQYAILLILIAAAIITPTHDVANLLIFAIPMFCLYECGIQVSGFIEKRQKSRNLLF